MNKISETYYGVVKRQALRVSKTAEKLQADPKNEDLMEDLEIHIKRLNAYISQLDEFKAQQ